MTALRFLPLAVLCSTSLAAQNVSRHILRGAKVAVYNLAGVVQLEAGSGDAVTVDVVRGGADAARLEVEAGELDGRATLRVIYPGDRIRYPQMDNGGSTELRVREGTTFGDGDGDHDPDPDRHGGGDHYGRRIRISDRAGGLEAWADLRLSVAAGRELAVHLAVGKLTVTNVDGRLRLWAANAPVTVDGANGELAVDVGAGDVRLTAVKASRVGLETGSGTVTVELQGDVERLDVQTGSGDIDTDFPLSVTRSARDQLRGTVGGGKGKISVETGSGGVRLLRVRS